MKIIKANTGSYPRVGDGPGQMRLRTAYQKWERGDISDEKLEESYQDYTREVIKEQEEAGLNVVTDGQLRWYDPFSHFAKKIQGCKVNGLLRYFDTNFYFRQPVVVDDLVYDNSLVKEEYLSAKEFTKKTLKPVITGPYTLAKHSIDQHYDNFEILTRDFSEIIGREIRELSEAGAEEIQVNEPSILSNPDDFDLFEEVIGEIAEEKEDSSLNLYVYFGDSTPLYSKLQELPIDILGLDFTYSPELSEEIEDKGSDKPLGLGLIDARNTKMEDSESVISTIEKIAPSVDADEIYLNPSCGIEFLPREKALEKLKNMVKMAEEAEEKINA